MMRMIRRMRVVRKSMMRTMMSKVRMVRKL